MASEASALVSLDLPKFSEQIAKLKDSTNRFVLYVLGLQQENPDSLNNAKQLQAIAKYLFSGKISKSQRLSIYSFETGMKVANMINEGKIIKEHILNLQATEDTTDQQQKDLDSLCKALSDVYKIVDTYISGALPNDPIFQYDHGHLRVCIGSFVEVEGIEDLFAGESRVSNNHLLNKTRILIELYQLLWFAARCRDQDALQVIIEATIAQLKHKPVDECAMLKTAQLVASFPTEETKLEDVDLLPIIVGFNYRGIRGALGNTPYQALLTKTRNLKLQTLSFHPPFPSPLLLPTQSLVQSVLPHFPNYFQMTDKPQRHSIILTKADPTATEELVFCLGSVNEGQKSLSDIQECIKRAADAIARKRLKRKWSSLSAPAMNPGPQVNLDNDATLSEFLHEVESLERESYDIEVTWPDLVGTFQEDQLRFAVETSELEANKQETEQELRRLEEDIRRHEGQHEGQRYRMEEQAERLQELQREFKDEAHAVQEKQHSLSSLEGALYSKEIALCNRRILERDYATALTKRLRALDQIEGIRTKHKESLHKLTKIADELETQTTDRIFLQSMSRRDFRDLRGRMLQWSLRHVGVFCTANFHLI